ncbi:MAG: hypothetical protein IPO04_21515 [Cytophagaceae bacterium]|nr:hypothetical protein [Cytophagaceae bacterium]
MSKKFISKDSVAAKPVYKYPNRTKNKKDYGIMKGSLSKQLSSVFAFHPSGLIPFPFYFFTATKKGI